MTKCDMIRDVLDQAKAEDIVVLDVRLLTDIADHMIIASGTSTRHVASVGRKVEELLRERGHRAQGVEGLSDGEWVLIDFGDVVVHVMHPKTRAFYSLEKLWSEEFGRSEEAAREIRLSR